MTSTPPFPFCPSNYYYWYYNYYCSREVLFPSSAVHYFFRPIVHFFHISSWKTASIFNPGSSSCNNWRLISPSICLSWFCVEMENTLKILLLSCALIISLTSRIHTNKPGPAYCCISVFIIAPDLLTRFCSMYPDLLQYQYRMFSSY